MSKLSKGPEIKMPKLKAPRFASDLFNDLKDRRLLPLIAVLAVAIVAVPIALKKSSPTLSSTTGVSGLPLPGATAAGPAPETVVAYAPGLRDYRRRLDHLQATDPFKQHFSTALVASGDATGTATNPTQIATGTPSSSTTNYSTVSPGPAATDYSSPRNGGGSGTPGNGSGSDGGSGGTGSGGAPATVRVETKYASYEIDVRIVSIKSGSGSGGSGSSSRRFARKIVTRRNLPELTMLPSRARPATVFMGVSASGKKALLLISSDVKSVFGDAHCVIGSQVCQLLALEPGLPETFIYGNHGRSYRIELLKITKIVANRPHRAHLGK